ncbi:MAG TPA: hypothetical protein VKV77_06900 [Methylovirgula sp.]|nr:hypothetical protein [Methylovirgula sp.]
MRSLAAAILGLGLAANGIVMLAVPSDWYASIPGVSGTGPFNAHFIRDIGAAYLVAGSALAWFALRGTARPAAQAAAGFLALHAAIHIWDAAAGREHVHQLILADGALVLLPSLLAIWIAWPLSKIREKSNAQMVSAPLDR